MALNNSENLFASHSVRAQANKLLATKPISSVEMENVPRPIITRICHEDFWGDGADTLTQILAEHAVTAPTPNEPINITVSAGKNTYSYDAHPYHTKVPPQGIAEILRQYLPAGGIVLDPFAGSGMTGVAARAMGLDVILNELSPAASFIAYHMTTEFDPALLLAGAKTILDNQADLRKRLYSTRCRSCGRSTEILFTVWSYHVVCYSCGTKFLLWDHCRYYGERVRDHKILTTFPCPHCGSVVKKARLQRTTTEPVMLGYKCCSPYQVETSLTADDHSHIRSIEEKPPFTYGFFPTTELPDGVNLSQPKRHGLTSVDRFYTPRNLAAMSALWRSINLIKDDKLAGFLAFVFTSLYKRVTKLSEFRFWGGSGNTANLNVPFIFNEANVFVTFERKTLSILDHLQTTARNYAGRAVVHTGSALDLRFLPDESVDLIFTDPPFGANINYSEMNILWEAWLGWFTDNTDEAIINRFQGKDVDEYGHLMEESLRECYRVLRKDHWMIMVFMNSSQKVWGAMRHAIQSAGFSIERIDIFDKQHGTFKQFVSENTAGKDLILHCKKKRETSELVLAAEHDSSVRDTIERFLSGRQEPIPRISYLHVVRDDEIDYRLLYSEFLAARFIKNGDLVDFPTFRHIAESLIEDRHDNTRSIH